MQMYNHLHRRALLLMPLHSPVLFLLPAGTAPYFQSLCIMNLLCIHQFISQQTSQFDNQHTQFDAPLTIPSTHPCISLHAVGVGLRPAVRSVWIRPHLLL